MELANVDIMSDKAILDYCNKYGLPHSSQLIAEKTLCMEPIYLLMWKKSYIGRFNSLSL